MALETGTYISDLVATNPTASDPKAQGDDHLRLLKSTIKTTFPNVAGAVTPTHVELNYVDGVTSAIQTQIDAKFDKAGGAITGDATIGGTLGVTGALSGTTGAFSGAVTGVTATAGDSTTKFATTAYVQGVAFTSALPNQTGNSGKFVTTDGANASWSLVPLTTGVSGVLPLANGGTNGGLTVSYGGTGAATFTDGGVIIGNGTGAFQVTSAGSAGQVLTSNGAGVDPTFQPNAQISGLVLLNVTDVSVAVAQVDFVSLITSAYDEYELHGLNVVPATNGTNVCIRTSSNNGSSFDSGGSDYSNGAAQIDLAHGGDTVTNTAANGGVNFVFRLFRPLSTTCNKSMLYSMVAYGNNTPTWKIGTNFAARNSTAIVNALRVYFDTGNIAVDSQLRFYGVRKV